MVLVVNDIMSMVVVSVMVTSMLVVSVIAVFVIAVSVVVATVMGVSVIVVSIVVVSVKIVSVRVLSARVMSTWYEGTEAVPSGASVVLEKEVGSDSVDSCTSGIAGDSVSAIEAGSELDEAGSRVVPKEVTSDAPRSEVGEVPNNSDSDWVMKSLELYETCTVLASLIPEVTVESVSPGVVVS